MVHQQHFIKIGGSHVIGPFDPFLYTHRTHLLNQQKSKSNIYKFTRVPTLP